VAIARLQSNPAALATMRAQARRAAEGRSWDAVFRGVYARYCEHLLPPVAEAQTKHSEFVSPNLHQKYNAR
jgi:hypothetical protein